MSKYKPERVAVNIVMPLALVDEIDRLAVVEMGTRAATIRRLLRQALGLS